MHASMSLTCCLPLGLDVVVVVAALSHLVNIRLAAVGNALFLALRQSLGG